MHTSTLAAAYGAVLTAALAITIARARRAEACTAERRAAAYTAGYQQCLRHVAAGLLEPASTRVDAERNDV